MKRFTLILLLFGLTTPAAAQIAVVDNPGSPWAGHATSALKFTEPITISTPDTNSVLILDLATFGNGNWNNFAISLGGTPLIQATGMIPAAGNRVDSTLYYLLDPPAGALSLSGTLGGATAYTANYYTLTGVNTSAAILTGTASGPTNPTLSLSLSTTSGAFAAISQASSYPGPNTGTYGATTGSPYSLSDNFVNSLFGSDGYIQGLAAGSNTFTAQINTANPTQHNMSVAVFSPMPVTGPPTWIGSSGSWSAGTNWSTGTAPDASRATAVFSQTDSLTETITLDDSPTIGSLTLGNSGLTSVSYVLTGNSLNLDNSGSGAILSVSGSQEIESQIAGAESLTMQGSGQLILSNSGNSFTGGTIVESGTLIITTGGALPDGSSLTVGAGGTFIFDPSVSAGPAIMAHDAGSVNPVPEPSTLSLAIIFLSTIFLCKKRVMRALLLISLLAIAGTAYGGEGGTGLQSPEPSTIGLFGAAVLFGVPAWFIRRRRKQQAEAENAAE